MGDMKKVLAVLIVLLMVGSLCACGRDSIIALLGNNSAVSDSNTSESVDPPAETPSGGDIVLFNTPASASPKESAAPNTNDKDVEKNDANNWYTDYYWQLKANIAQNEEFGSLVGKPGMYADYVYDISMTGGGDSIADSNMTVEGTYALVVKSTITMDTDEAADRMLSSILGEVLSGLGLGIDVELSGEYYGGIPYYIDDNGMPAKPEYDENFEPIWPDGKTNASMGAAYVHKIAENWLSPIIDKNGNTVQPAAGSYLMFDAFTMKYTGSSSHVLVGSFDEELAYDIYLFIVIEPSQSGIMDLGDFDAKVYLNLVTSEHHEIWLEGEGTMTLVEESFEKN